MVSNLFPGYAMKLWIKPNTFPQRHQTDDLTGPRTSREDAGVTPIAHFFHHIFFESCPGVGVPWGRGILGHAGAHRGRAPAARPSCPSPPAHNRKHHHHGVLRRPKLHDGGRQNYRTVDATDNITTGPQREFRGRRGCVLDATDRLLQRPGELNT
jgi:hypothetical protein